MTDLSGQLPHVEPALAPLWLIPLVPLLGAVILAIFGRRLAKSSFGEPLAKKLHAGSFGVTLVALSAMLGAFGLVAANVAHLAALAPGHRSLYSFAWPLVRIGTLEASFAFVLDPLSAVMALVVTGVGVLVHVYAAVHMAKDASYARFFASLTLFVSAMLLLVLGDNLLVMFFGWEGVGLASYLLIGFRFQDPASARAGMKAFIVQRIGDVGFLLGMVVLFWGMSGQWTDGQWFADAEARFVAIEAREPGESAPKASAEARDKAKAASSDDDDDDEAELERVARNKGAMAGKKGYLTMTAYPGARVYLGIYDGSQLEATLPPPLLAVSPFEHVEVPVGLTSIAIVPGGAVTVGGGYEAALLRSIAIDAGKETVLTTQGGSLTFREIEAQLAAEDATGHPALRAAIAHSTIFGMSVVTLACLLFFFAATAMSAQLPLLVWLPDAMAGPTPVSALVHAATMVTAGVYLIARLSFLFALSPAACAVVASIGAVTALAAALMAMAQHDLKKLLAYGTASQLGFMVLGVGVGAYTAGVFHLVTHALFEGCLFLAAGSVLYGMRALRSDDEASQDVRRMGGLAKPMPRTARAYRAACIAAAAAPIPLFAGFWSKDAILWKTLTNENTGPVPGSLLWAVALVGASCASFALWRSYYLVFEGEPADASLAKKVHEPPRAMLVAVEILALLSIVSGAVLGFSSRLVGGHGASLLEEWLAPVFAHADVAFAEHGLFGELGAAALAFGAAAFTWSAAKKRYGAGRKKTWATDEATLPLHALATKGFHLDAVYEATVVRAVLALRVAAADLERFVVGALVDRLALAARSLAATVGLVDERMVDGPASGVANGALAAGAKLRLQPGRLLTYVTGLLAGAAVLALIDYLLQ